MITTRFQSPQRLILSVLVVCGLSSKFLHLYQHSSTPLAILAIYFPTFFIQEVLLVVAAWFFLHKTVGWWSVLAVLTTGILACVNLVASASQFSFYYKTGGEIRWDAARSVGASQAGLKLILSGLGPTLVFSTIFFTASWFAAPGIYAVLNRWLGSLSQPWSASREDPADDPFYAPASLKGGLVSNRSRLWTIIVGSVTVALWLVRPQVPFSHMSEALPFAMFGAHSKGHDEPSEGGFPFQELLADRYKEPAAGYYKGWGPTALLSTYAWDKDTLPEWAVDALPPGFERWEPRPDANTTDSDSDTHGHGGGPAPGYENEDGTALDEEEQRFYYDPTTDHMRISNFDEQPLAPLEEALKERDIPINHIAFIFLESGRKDLFPFKKGSRLYDQIRETWPTDDPDKEKELFEKLARLTPNAEYLSGETSGFDVASHDDEEIPAGLKPIGPEYGGINFDGVVTGSTLSAKSRLVNYCGLGPLPVDFMHENDIMPYQPCLMHVLDLFNKRKDNSTGGASVLDKEWHTVYAQSVTGKFQDQFRLMESLGFKESIYSENIDRPKAKHWHSGMEKINYFGYAETEVAPYMRDAINETLSANKRLFLSHFTSSTHHPWGTPDGFDRETYFGEHASQHKDMDAYLNANRFVDTWLADLMGMLHEAGIANETLTVFVGDHGQAFREDCQMTGTYDNPHISNFRVPLLFHHPLLPRMNIASNASTVSIVPTILDLMVKTRSLNKHDADIANDLINQYEGQSLIRPYHASHNGREAWNMGVINAGGTMLSVGSAAAPFRLIYPLTPDIEYRFTSLEADPYELSPITDWTLSGLADKASAAYGPEAGEWAERAEKMGAWWVTKQKKLWDYTDEKE